MLIRQSSLALGLLLLISGVSWSSATNYYTVGDAAGWTTGVDYIAWAAGKTFLVGDFLIFNYASDDTVDWVTLSEYSSCSLDISDGLISYSGGNTTVAIRAAGTSYFISGAPGHCSAGMKLTVTTTPTGTGTEDSGTVSIEFGPVRGLAIIGLGGLVGSVLGLF